MRVIDFTWEQAGPWATRLLSNLGAEVIKVEWPQPGLHYHRNRVSERQVPPGTEAGLNNNPTFSFWHAGKRSVTVNLRTPPGLDAVKRLLRVSDVVVENFSSGVLEKRGLSYAEMRAQNPEIIYVSMAGLGHTGRNHEYKTFGPVVQSLCGLTQLSGLPGEEPAGLGWAYMDQIAGMHAALSAMAAWHHRLVTGKGQYIDLAQVAVGMAMTGAAWLDYTVNGRPSRREGFPPGNRTYWPGSGVLDSYRGLTTAPHNAYRAAATGDDIDSAWCVIACYSDAEWQRLVCVMGEPAWATAECFRTLLGRLEYQDELDQHIEEWTRQHDKYEVMRLCQEATVHAMPVQDARDRVESDPQLVARGVLQELPHPVIGLFKYQGVPWEASGMDLTLPAAGPLAGEHNVQILLGLLGLSREEVRQGYEDGTFWPKELPVEPYLVTALDASGSIDQGRPPGVQQPDRVLAPTSFSKGAFGDLRVLEVGDAYGQWAAKLLADLGADVIKVEPPDGSDERRVGPFYEDVPDRNGSLAFWHCNTSKRGITLNLETEDGKNMLRRLIASVDVLIESYAPGYLPSLGLGYEELKQLNRRLIVCSVTPFGQTGPWRNYLSSDLLQLGADGLMVLSGYDEADVRDAPPIAPTGGQAYLVGGMYAGIAVAAALCQRDATGEGQYLDVSTHAACSLTDYDHMHRYVSLKQVGKRQTGRGASIRLTQKNQFRCKDGAYLTFLWSNDMTPDHLAILAYWMDEYGLAQDLLDEGYQDEEAIAANSDHITEVIRQFLTCVDGEEAYHRLQERGFAAGTVRTVEDIVQDPHWADRCFLVSVEHPELGKRFTYPGAYAIFSETPWAISRRAPSLGNITPKSTRSLA